MAGKTPRPPASEARVLVPLASPLSRVPAPAMGGLSPASPGGHGFRGCSDSRCMSVTVQIGAVGATIGLDLPEEEGRIVLPHYEYGLDVALATWSAALSAPRDAQSRSIASASSGG